MKALGTDVESLSHASLETTRMLNPSSDACRAMAVMALTLSPALIARAEFTKHHGAPSSVHVSLLIAVPLEGLFVAHAKTDIPDSRKCVGVITDAGCQVSADIRKISLLARRA